MRLIDVHCIGLAKAGFLTLAKVWKRSALTWPKKLCIFNAVVESKLLYSLSCLSLSKRELARLDGFQNRCIRAILGIQPSFLSRVSNAAVLEKACHRRASQMLEKRQLQILGKILRSPSSHPLQKCSFAHGFSLPLTEWYIRRKGRPSKS